ncbi:MAG: DUF2934 domain-containing protein [Opitutaceae bacterium]
MARDLKPVTAAQIAALAHELWLGRGCPAGQDIDIWLEAERLLQGDINGGHRNAMPADPNPSNAEEDPAGSARWNKN